MRIPLIRFYANDDPTFLEVVLGIVAIIFLLYLLNTATGIFKKYYKEVVFR
jgi:hypothetical protein